MKNIWPKLIKKETAILILILVVAGFLRFWQLGRVPPSPDWDEAALGYNAYSILETGKDEYGVRLPLILRSFDDYKPALYVYFIIPLIKVFGLNILAVRFPAAIFGTLSVLLVYLLVKRLFKDRRFALIAAALMAISPWHLHFSRVAFETNVALFFDILVVYLILLSFKKAVWLIPAAALAGLNLYLYQAEKVFLPLLLISLAVIWHQEILKIPKKYLAGAIIIGLLVCLPFIYYSLTTPEIFLRAKGTSLIADQTPFLARTVQKLVTDSQNKDLLGLALDNRRITYLQAFIAGHLAHFDLNWLFLRGDEARHHAPGMGLMYLLELPFLLIGVYSLVFGNFTKKVKYSLFTWLLLAPVPAAFTSGVPHAVRTIRMLPIVPILVALGLIQFLDWSKARGKIKFLIIGGFSLVALFNFGYYLDQYFIQQNYFYSSSWQYGYEQAVAEVAQIAHRYDQIVVSNQPHLDQSYMFFLFYLKYDPRLYQQRGGTVSGGFLEDRNAFDKYVFRMIDWSREQASGKILYIGRPDDYRVGMPVVKTINFLDGQPAIIIFEGK